MGVHAWWDNDIREWAEEPEEALPRGVSLPSEVRRVLPSDVPFSQMRLYGHTDERLRVSDFPSYLGKGSFRWRRFDVFHHRADLGKRRD